MRFSAYANKNNNWIVEASFAAAVICVFIACYLAWRDEHKKLLIEQKKNEGSRIEGKINFALIDQKKRVANGTVVMTESECFVTVLLYATNINPADAWFNLWAADVNLTLHIDGAVYRGKYEALASGRIEFVTTLDEIKIKNIFDFFDRYQSGPMQDGLPNSGWLRFRFDDIARIMQAARERTPVLATLAFTDTRSKTHEIPARLVLRTDKIRHCSEPPAM